jgi:hypothetical protein
MAVQVAYSEQAAALRCARALVRDDLTWREAETLRLLDDRYQKSVAFSASTLLTGSPRAPTLSSSYLLGRSRRQEYNNLTCHLPLSAIHQGRWPWVRVRATRLL